MILALSALPESFILLAGFSLLMILFTARSLSEEQGRLLAAAQLLLSTVLCLFSGNYLLFLLFTEYRGGKRQGLRFCLPAIFYLAMVLLAGVLSYIQTYALKKIPEGMLAKWRAFMPEFFLKYQEKSLAEKLLSFLILVFLSGILYIVEKMISGYMAAREQTTRAVTVAAVNEMYEKKLNQELALKNYLAEKNARFQEREAISRNIHNSVGHSITAAIMTLDAADMLFPNSPDAAREKMNIAAGRIRESLSSIRRAVRVLDTENEWISWEDFVNSLAEISERFTMDFSTTDNPIRVRSDFAPTHGNPQDAGQAALQDCGVLSQEYNQTGNRALPREHTEFLTGAFQELLTNGVKHGHADSFIVHLSADSAHVRLSVLDNGNSDFNEGNLQERLEKGFGLKKLVSYAKNCGGMTSFSNENGFLAEISLPLQ